MTITIRELIDKDFNTAFPTVLNSRTGLCVEDIFDSSHSTIINDLDRLRGVKGVKEEELITLKGFLQLMEEAQCCADFDPQTESELCNYATRFPKLESFKFCLILYKVDGYIELGFTDDEIVDFYKSTFKNHPNLIELDDFFSESKFLLPILLLDKQPIELISVLNDAIKNYPGKAYLKNVLSRIYEANNAIDSALSYSLEFLGQLETEKVFDEDSKSYRFNGDDITIEDFHLGLLTAANLSFKNKDYKSSLVYCDKLLLEYQQYKNYEYSMTNLFIDPIVIRLKIFMMHSDEEFRKDFELLISKVEPEVLLQEEYRDIVSYAKKIKLY